MAFWSRSKKGSESQAPVQPAERQRARQDPLPPPTGLLAKSNGATPCADMAKPTRALSEIDAKLRATNKFWKSVGECVGLLMRSPQHKQMSLEDLEKLLLPPVTLGQFMVAENRSGEDDIQRPVAIALWASVSPEVDRRLTEATDGMIALSGKDWKSGDIVWLTTLAGEDKFVAMIVKQLQETALKGRAIKVRARDKGGAVHVKEIAARA